VINALSDEGVAALRRFASADPLLGLDYDGTLAPICEDRQQAYLSDHTRYLLQVAALCYPTVVISGRSRGDLLRLVGDVPGLECVGNHGAEAGYPGAAGFAGQVRSWSTKLMERLGHMPGLVIEDKRLSLSIHYRACHPWATARAVVLDAVSDLKDARITGGKAVVNVVPASAPHKGEALLNACAQRRKTHAIYVGDDETDEDVFNIDDAERILTIQVGHRAGSNARYFLRDQAQLDQMLGLLIRCRRGDIHLKEHPAGWGWTH
jgi:trehalose 6-phosphate phosphatase